MSTVKATNIQNGSSSVANAVTTSGGDLTNAAGVSFMGGSKNLLYNGAMQVAQRGTSTASITASGYYTADRWNTLLSSLGTWTQSVESDGPTGSGLTKSLKYLCTTASASPAAASYFAAYQTLEGQDVQRVAKGTASAQQLTLSFWVKSNKTGTYVAELRDVANARTVSTSYSISASATWEKKTIAFPADTTGTLANDNTGAFQVYFWLAAGSDYTSGTLATTWASTTAANRAVGQTNLAAATNNYWQVTGAQLEIGSVGSSFGFKSNGQELAECQRYYYRTTPGASNGIFGTGFAYTTVAAVHAMNFPTEMRIVPTALETSGTAGDYRITNGAAGVITCSAVPVFSACSKTAAEVATTVASGLTVGQGSLLRATGANGYLAWSAEL